MRRQRPLHEKIVSVFTYLMAAVYVLVGIGIIAAPVNTGLPDSIKIAFGSLLILYGVFRMVRVYKQTGD